MVVRLSALRTGRIYPRKYSWYSFLLKAELTPGPSCDRKDYVNEKFQWHHLESNQPPSDLQRSTLTNVLPRSPLSAKTKGNFQLNFCHGVSTRKVLTKWYWIWAWCINGLILKDKNQNTQRWTNNSCNQSTRILYRPSWDRNKSHQAEVYKWLVGPRLCLLDRRLKK